MKAILEFSLPEEQEEFNTAITGGKAQSVLFELNQFFFRLKDSEITTEELNTIDLIHEEFHNLLDNHNVKL